MSKGQVSLSVPADLARELWRRLFGCEPTVGFRIGPVAEQRVFQGQEITTVFVLKATQQVEINLAVTDRKGNPAKVDGVPNWLSSALDIVTVHQSPDGMSAVAVANQIGTAQIRVEADADLGDGVVPIVGVLDVEVLAGDAAVIVLNPGQPVDQP